MKIKREFQATPDAQRQLNDFDVYAHRIILEGLRIQLVDNDPDEETWHKGPLKTPVGGATHKVDIQKWRAYYKVERTGATVCSTVLIIGEKRGNKLFVEGKEYPT